MPVAAEAETVPESSIAEVRNSFVEEVKSNANAFDPIDIEKIKSNDWAVKRFIIGKKGDLKEASKALIEAAKWRKTIGVNHMKNEDFPYEYYKCGGVFTYSKDKNGSKLLILRVKMNKKISEWVDTLRKYIVFLMENVDNGTDNGITVIFDCADAGLSNVDIDLLQFIVQVLRDYYPKLLTAVLVHELPWVLQWVFKLVQTWLPEDQRKMIHTINRKELSDYIDENQRPDFLDGKNPESYRIVPKEAPRAEELAPKLGLRQKDVEKLMKHLEPYLNCA